MSNVATILSLVSKVNPSGPATTSTPLQPAQVVPLDGGNESQQEIMFQILVELRVTNDLLRRALTGDAADDLDALRADQLIEPSFIVQR